MGPAATQELQSVVYLLLHFDRGYLLWLSDHCLTIGCALGMEDRNLTQGASASSTRGLDLDSEIRDLKPQPDAIAWLDFGVIGRRNEYIFKRFQRVFRGL